MDREVAHRPYRVTQERLGEERWIVDARCACGFAFITYGPREAAEKDAFSRLLLHVRAASQEGKT